MTTATAIPSTTLTTVRVEIPKELSGPQWCSRYPRSDSIALLQPKFQFAVSSFLWALEQAGASYHITNTFRPLESCYLMRTAWLIFKQKLKPENAEPYPGVPINWVHETAAKSIEAAKSMCAVYQILGLDDAPAAKSNHSKGLAIDVSITWSGTLKVLDANDKEVVIESAPRNNMNPELWKVGATFGVKRYHRPEHDRPHWSVDGF